MSQEIHRPEDGEPIAEIAVAPVVAARTQVNRLEQGFLYQIQDHLGEPDVEVSVSQVDLVLVAPEKQWLIREEGWVDCD